MKHRHCVLAVAAITIAGALAPAISAQNQRTSVNTNQPGNADVTLRVPVQLQNLNPAATLAIVYCRAYASGGGGPSAWAQDTVPLTQGSFNGSVDVKLSLLASQSGLKWDYTCTLWFYNATLKATAPPGGAPWITAKAGTTPVGTASGSVTTQ
jgi:hypothetical protein